MFGVREDVVLAFFVGVAITWLIMKPTAGESAYKKCMKLHDWQPRAASQCQKEANDVDDWQRWIAEEGQK